MFNFMTTGPRSETIRNKCNFHLVDLRNHGDSEWNSEITYPLLADDIKNYLGNSKKIVLVGHSMGGKAAITFACKWPHLVKGLVSIDAPPQNRN
jgi:esterase